MRSAADSRIVQAIYGFTTGPSRYIFFGLVTLAVLIGVYFPVRDLYTAYRTGDILARQLEVRNAYNEQLEGEVDRLLSTEGIEDVAREELGLVMPGEHSVTVIGIDDEPASEEDDGTKDPEGIRTSGDDASEGEDAEGASGEGEATDAADQKDAAQKGDESKADAASDDSANEAGAASKSEDPTTSSEVEEAELAVVDDAPWYIKLLDVLFFYQGVEGQTVRSTGE